MDLNTSNKDPIKSLTYKPGTVLNPITKQQNTIIFADDTASGRPCPLIESLIAENVYPYYSNTHSNATCGCMMKDMIDSTREFIRTELKLSDSQKLFFCGNGCTGAVNQLVSMIDDDYDKIIIHSSPYEHHSNFLPWIEWINTNNKKFDHKVLEHRIIDYDDNIELQLDSYINNLDVELLNQNSSRLDIFTLSACSNVTGERYDLKYSSLWSYIKSKKSNTNMYLILDYACSAPYVNIDLSTCDGCFFSGHKFLGGQGAPGVLIVNEKMIQTNKPCQPGGGCVIVANDKNIQYKQDIESICGTPNIVGIIRLGCVLALKKTLISYIREKEEAIEAYVSKYFTDLEAQFPDFKVIGSKRNHNLPIYPIVIDGMHYNLITVLLNDLFGIQSRGGISCSGTFGRLIKEKTGYNGWCRISFNYLLNKTEIDTVLNGLQFIIVNKVKLSKLYSYDLNKNLYFLKQTNNYPQKHQPEQVHHHNRLQE